MKAAKLVALSCAITLTVTACESNRDMGILAGAAAGAAAGSRVGDGGGRAAAIIIGALIGAVAGGVIGEKLDEAERIKKEAAARAAAQEEGPVIWRSDKDPATYGRAEQLPEPESARPGSDGQQADAERKCRTVREIVVIKGKESKEETRYCLVDGAWKAS